MLIASDKFRGLAERVAMETGLAAARIASVRHPVGGVALDELTERADGIVDEVIKLLVDPSR